MVDVGVALADVEDEVFEATVLVELVNSHSEVVVLLVPVVAGAVVMRMEVWNVEGMEL